MTRSFLPRLLAAAGAAALLTAAGGASAQSMYGDMFSYTPETWTGGYVGVFGAFTQENGQDDETVRFDRNLDGNFGDPVILAGSGANAFSPGFCDGNANGPAVATGCDEDTVGTQGGIRAGYDYQVGSFVIGAVADYSALNQEDSVTAFSTTPAYYTFTRTLQRLGAIRARVGYAYGPTLAYVTGGYAAGELDNSYRTSNGANTFTARVDDDEADGYQLGGGLEFALAPNLSLTGEYLYTSLDAGDYVIRTGPGTAPATNPFILAPFTTGTDQIRSNSRFGMHGFSLGMSYRF